jgi:DNA-binding NarL/FixJ family response regulator
MPTSAGPGRIRVLVVDDHRVVREGLRTFLATQDDIEVVGEAADGAQAVSAAAELYPDVVLLDLQMPGTDGLSALRRLREGGGRPRILVLTSFTDDAKLLPAVRAGVDGYLYKDVDPDALASAIRAVHHGAVLLDPDVAARLLRGTGGATGPAPSAALEMLTDREREVLAEVARGRSNREIARVLYVSEKTVKTHVSSVLSKLGMADRTQAAVFAVRHGLGGDEPADG